MRKTEDWEHRVQDRVELPGTSQVVAEWLLDHNPAPRPLAADALRRSGQPGPLELGHYLREGLRRHGQVEGVVTAGPALDVEPGEAVGEVVERLIVRKFALHEPHALGHLPPDRL